jgi:hypothetical protein
LLPVSELGQYKITGRPNNSKPTRKSSKNPKKVKNRPKSTQHGRTACTNNLWSFWNGSKTREYGNISALETQVREMDNMRQSVQGKLEDPTNSILD